MIVIGNCERGKNVAYLLKVPSVQRQLDADDVVNVEKFSFLSQIKCIYHRISMVVSVKIGKEFSFQFSDIAMICICILNETDGFKLYLRHYLHVYQDKHIRYYIQLRELGREKNI